MVILCGLFFIAELLSFIAVTFLLKKGIFYSPPIITPQEYKDYLARRDIMLGWPPPDQFGKTDEFPYEEDGSRLSPAFPLRKSKSSCISLYGNSFTFGSLNPEIAWSNILSLRLNCRVANYGVGGYGTDQAYLRFRGNINDNSPIVILGFSTENILRNVNQYKFLLYRSAGQKFSLKPRFIINPDGELELIPLPKYKYENFLELIMFPEKVLNHEYFLPGSKMGIYRIKLPFSLSFIKALFNNFHIKSEIKRVPWYSDFYKPDHPSQALNITLKIMEKFYRDTKKLNKKPIIFVIPTGLDLRTFERTEKWPYEILINKLVEKNINFIDAGPAIIDYIKERDPCELFIHCSAHYNEEGERVLADIVYNFIEKDYFPREKLK